MADKESTDHKLPQERAVALQYGDIKKLPKVVASGRGKIAEQIIRIADEHKIPVHADNALAELLSKVDVGSSVGPDTFRLIAETVCFLYFVDSEWREQHQFLAPVVDLSDDS